MRLLYVSHSFPPADRPMSNVGGMQRVAMELHGALTRHPNVELDELLLRSSWKYIHVKTPFFLMRCWAKLCRRIDQGEIDAVLFSSMVTASLALPLHRLAERRGVFLAAIAHGRDVTLPSSAYQHLIPRVLRSLDAVFPVSEATAIESHLRGLPTEKASIVPNGVDLSRFDASRQKRRALRNALFAKNGIRQNGQADNAFVLLSVGRLIERKGFAWFIRKVMPLLPERVHYWLAGNGPEAEAIQQAIQETGLEHRIHQLGRVSEAELGALYHGADLFVMPNVPVAGDMEGFGVVMLEAGQCGLPTVAARLEGIQDVIEEGKNGRLVPAEDPAAFSRTIRGYIDQPERLAAASTRTADYIAQTYGWRGVADKYVRRLSAKSAAAVSSVENEVAIPQSA